MNLVSGGIAGQALAQAQAQKEAASLAGIPGNPATRDRSQLEVAAERHGLSLSRLNERLCILVDRLQPVLRPSTPPTPPTGINEKSQEIQAPIAEALNQVARQIDGMTFQVEDLLNRLAL